MFFHGKVCEICGKQATTMRFMRDRTFIICDKKECDKTTRERVGMFDDLLKQA